MLRRHRSTRRSAFAAVSAAHRSTPYRALKRLQFADSRVIIGGRASSGRRCGASFARHYSQALAKPACAPKAKRSKTDSKDGKAIEPSADVVGGQIGPDSSLPVRMLAPVRTRYPPLTAHCRLEIRELSADRGRAFHCASFCVTSHSPRSCWQYIIRDPADRQSE
jgi:hypothetical protein